MPMYEYRCGRCKKDFEELVYGDEEIRCPKCGGKQVKKLMSRCSHRSGSRSGGDYASGNSGGSGCAGCSGGNCGSCH
jgi:putative FmdB family regulatory protein